MLSSIIFGVFFASTFVIGQQPEQAPAAPVPPSIASARSIFVSNAGEESNFQLVSSRWYGGGPNRAYNELYAALKAWGKFELAAAPADADVVFEIGFNDKSETLAQLKLVILDAKTHTTLWTLTRYLQVAGTAKNREKNYNLAMTALVTDLKSLVTPGSAPANPK